MNLTPGFFWLAIILICTVASCWRPPVKYRFYTVMTDGPGWYHLGIGHVLQVKFPDGQIIEGEIWKLLPDQRCVVRSPPRKNAQRPPWGMVS